MNRLLMTVSDRWSVKRVSMVAVAMLVLTGLYAGLMAGKASAAACVAPPTDYGTASTTIKIPSAATYRVWTRLMAPDANSNSYLLEIDGNNCFTVGDGGVTANTWTWVDYQNGAASSKVQQSLSAGDHTIKLIGREAGVKVGRLLFVSDLNCVPTGNGDNCATTGDTEVPAVTVTAPAANATVSGTVNVTATASDNIGVTKVEFYVNGALKATDSSSPYAYSWDSKTVANGPVSIAAKAYDAAGNSNSSTVQVAASNGDTQAPTVPGGVTAQAGSPTKVTVQWTASTDNTGVAGYWVTRNGQTLGKVEAGTQYIDDTVLPNTAYSYRVSAVDAAGNTSANSAEAKVTTPNVADTQAPSAPTNVSAGAQSSNQINLSWSPSTDNVGVASYDVYRAISGGTASRIAQVNARSYGDTGLQASTTYSYYVVARDAAGNTSANSTTVSAQTEATPPPPQQTGFGKLYGRVIFAANSERRAQVVLTIKGVKRTYDTDRRGYYYITNIPAGTYQVTYQAKGSYSKVVTVKINAGRDKIQDVTLRRR